MKFRILGSLEVHTDGAMMPVGGLRERTVLAVLVLETGRAVPVTRLIDAVWADNPPETAAKYGTQVDRERLSWQPA
jgi:DNA-binding SARP family transcriptional activator